MKITLDITAQDFDHLTTMQMRWAGTDWKEKGDRFEPVIPQTEVDYNWQFAYWCDTYADYLLAAAYLKSIAEPHQALFDGAIAGDITILTDYAGTWSD